MLTTPSPFKSDPRVMCGLIASTSLRLIEKKPTEASSRQVFEATLLRLLEIYEHDAFRHGPRRSILTRTPMGEASIGKRADVSNDVRAAIQGAHKKMYPGVPRKQFCEMIAE